MIHGAGEFPVWYTMSVERAIEEHSLCLMLYEALYVCTNIYRREGGREGGREIEREREREREGSTTRQWNVGCCL